MKSRNTLAMLLALFCFACQLDKKDTELPKDSFSLVISLPDIPQGRLFSGNLDLIDGAIVKITKKDGTDTEYNNIRLKISKIGDQWVTEKIMLHQGEYFVTEFILVDVDNNVLFASPHEGSTFASVVNFPLPLQFSLGEGVKNELPVEVLNANGVALEDFGITTVGLEIVSIFNINLSVIEKGDAGIFLNAHLTITAGDYLFEKELDNKPNHQIAIMGGLNEYMLVLENPDFYSYEYTFSLDSLLQYREVPLVVEMSKIEQDLCLGGSYEGDVILFSQEEINDFGKYCYVKIEGSLRIGDFSPEDPESIVDLSPLNTLVEVSQKVEILSNHNLESLDGLENLRSIGGDFTIYQNLNLKSLEKLQSLNSVSADITIEKNPALANLNGLSKLGRGLGNIVVRRNEGLKSLEGLNNVNGANSVFIENNAVLTSLDGIGSLRSVASIYIKSNSLLTDFCGISKLFFEDDDVVSVIEGNAYNPSVEQMMSPWECKQ